MSLLAWFRRLLGCEPRGYWVCPDDWQGQLSECRYIHEPPPVAGVMVYYQSGTGELKPYR